MSKYFPLRDHLFRQRLSRVQMKFSEIEEVLGFPLPKSARLYAAWWANQAPPSSQSMAWTRAGWQTQEVDLASGRVTFARVLGQSPSASPPVPGKKIAQENVGALPPGKPANMVQPIAAGPAEGRCTASFSWAPVSEIARRPDGRLAAHIDTAMPALYRFRLTGSGGERRYIGETANLARRIYMYCNPGPSQMTNLRLNQLFSQHLHFGGQVCLDAVLKGARVEIDAQVREIDMANRFDRRFLENAAILLELQDKSILLNA